MKRKNSPRAQASAESLMAFLFLLVLIIVLSAASARFSDALKERLSASALEQSRSIEFFKLHLLSSLGDGKTVRVPQGMRPLALCPFPSGCAGRGTVIIGGKTYATYEASDDVPV